MNFDINSKRNTLIDRFYPSIVSTYKILMKEFPNLFDPKNIKPLSKTCKKEILQRSTLDSKKINHFFNDYTRYFAYRVAICNSSNRYNVDGELDGEVTEFEKMCAMKSILKYKEDKAKRDEELKTAKPKRKFEKPKKKTFITEFVSKKVAR